MENATKIQAVINTLETVMIPATYDNVNKILGIYRTLAEVRDDVNREGQEDEQDHAG